jgi:hypothetical protein
VGLFGWLFGKRERVNARDWIWLSDVARMNGVAESIDSHLAAGRPALVLAHFPSTLAAFGEHLMRPDRPHAAVPSVLTPAAALQLAATGPRVLFGLVRNLRPDEFPSVETAPPSPLAVVVLERHFLRTHDDQVANFAEGLGGSAAVEFHVSLDDPLLKMFSGEWVANVLRRLGMEEDEALDSAMVSRRMRAAQGKIAKTTPTDHQTDSPAEWLDRNRAG